MSLVSSGSRRLNHSERMYIQVSYTPCLPCVCVVNTAQAKLTSYCSEQHASKINKLLPHYIQETLRHGVGVCMEYGAA